MINISPEFLIPFTESVFSATEGQTSISTIYLVGMIRVEVNGSELFSTIDFTASNGTSITFVEPLSLNDSIKVTKYKDNLFKILDVGDVDGIDSIGIVQSAKIKREFPYGLKNGSNLTHLTYGVPISGSWFLLFINGVLMEEGVGADYIISGSTITLTTALTENDSLSVYYIYATQNATWIDAKTWSDSEPWTDL